MRDRVQATIINHLFVPGTALVGSKNRPIVVPDLATHLPYGFSGTSSGYPNEVTCGYQQGPTVFFQISVSKPVTVSISACNPGTSATHGILLGIPGSPIFYNCGGEKSSLFATNQGELDGNAACALSPTYPATGAVALSSRDEYGNITYVLVMDCADIQGGYFNLTIGTQQTRALQCLQVLWIHHVLQNSLIDKPAALLLTSLQNLS